VNGGDRGPGAPLRLDDLPGVERRRAAVQAKAAVRRWLGRRLSRCLVGLVARPARGRRFAPSGFGALAVDACLFANAERVAAIQRGVVSGELFLAPAKRGLRQGELVALVLGQM